jgi:prepilin-type N-terminal cleavage/methylation domain-containing protein
VRSERGFTLIELVIAITLVSAISAGMLLSLRTGILTLEKTEARLQENRRVVAIQKMLIEQLAETMPAMGDCLAGGRVPLFSGTDRVLHFVTSYSLGEGSRGAPQYVQILIVPDPQGGLRLVEEERLFFGPSSSAPFCAPFDPTPQSFEITRGLAACRIIYREYTPDNPNGGNWVPVWNRPNLPSAIRIEMTPLRVDPAHLAVQTVDVPIRINREVAIPYDDQ